MEATHTIILEKRRTLSDGSHPVKLRVTHDRKQKYYTLNITDRSAGENKQPKYGLTPGEWEKVMGDRPRGIYKDYRTTINETDIQAGLTIKMLSPFTFAAFEAQFFKKDTLTDLFAAMLSTAKDFYTNNSIKTAQTYEYAVKSLQTFRKSDRLPFSKVTPELLRKYAKWMLSRHKSETTVSIYLRCVRAAFNKAGITENYPFGRERFEIPEGRNVKKALTIQDIGKIYNYETMPGSHREKCRDYFLLSYLCNGINMKDLALLKYRNIDSEAITFIRAKTANRSKKKRAIIVPLTVEIGRLIDKHGQKPAFPESYVLPILNDGMSAAEQRTAIDNVVRLMNKQLKIIAANCGINTTVSTYTARHSFATVLKRSGASTEFISESLGHKSLQTTENYLADFEIDRKREIAKFLTAWK